MIVYFECFFISKNSIQCAKILGKRASLKKKSNRDKAAYLGVDNSTLYNWRKYKPNLYRIVMLGFEFDTLLAQSKAHCEELSKVEEKIEEELYKAKNPKAK